MQRPWFYRLLYALTFLLAIILHSGCGGAKLISERAYNVVIDGRDNEWVDRQYYFKDERITIGVAHDDEYFYLYLNTVDRALQMQVLRGGFSVFFDADGGKKTQFGVRYPLEMDPHLMWEITDRQSPKQGTQSQNSGDFPSRRGTADPALVAAIFEKAILNNHLELIGKSLYDKRRLPRTAVPEMEVALNYDDGRLGYELKVPLRCLAGENYTVGIGTESGKSIGLGFATAKIDMQAMRQNMRGGTTGLGREGKGLGGSGKRGGGRRSGPPSDLQAIPQPLQLWTQINLAND